MYFLTTPPGMDMYPDRAPYPYDSLHLYQIRKSDIRGTYSASVSVVKGTEKAFFHGKREKAARFGSAHSMKMRHGRTPSSACRKSA